LPRLPRSSCRCRSSRSRPSSVGSIPISSTTLLNRGDDHRHASAA
jgi:hypothetical protein